MNIIDNFLDFGEFGEFEPFPHKDSISLAISQKNSSPWQFYIFKIFNFKCYSSKNPKIILNTFNQVSNHKLQYLKSYKLLSFFYQSKLTPTFSMKFFRSKTLSDVLNTPSQLEMLNFENILYCLFAVSEGMLYLHDHLIYHGNLCPSNVIIDEACQFYLCDFGLYPIKKLYLEEDQIFNKVYKDPYMDNNEPTSKNDVYSFGILMSDIFFSYMLLSKNRAPTLQEFISGKSKEFDSKQKHELLEEFIKNPNRNKYDVFPQFFGELISSCINSFVSERPSFKQIVNAFKKADETYNGTNIQQTYYKFINNNYLLNLASKGDPYALNKVGSMYEHGKVFEKNIQLAMKYYKEAADKNNSKAQNNLGLLLQKKIGNIIEGAHYLRHSAEQGNIQGMANYGIALLYGHGVEKNIQKAIDYLKKSADLGCSYAQVNYGYTLLNNNTTISGTIEGLKYIKQAMNQNSSDAYYTYGNLLQNGQHVEKDDQLAMEYFKIAADMGHEKAMIEYAEGNYDGIGVPMNKKIALLYYKKAFDRGNDEVKDINDSLKEDEYLSLKRQKSQKAFQEQIPKQLMKASSSGSFLIDHDNKQITESKYEHEPTPIIKNNRSEKSFLEHSSPNILKDIKPSIKNNVDLPFIVSKTIKLINLGEIIYDRPNYHNENYIYPVGYQIEKEYYSIENPSKKATYRASILDGGESPLFRVECLDNTRKIFEGYNPKIPWNNITNAIEDARRQLNIQAKKKSIPGTWAFGFPFKEVIKMIENLPNASRCKYYKFKNDLEIKEKSIDENELDLEKQAPESFSTWRSKIMNQFFKSQDANERRDFARRFEKQNDFSDAAFIYHAINDQINFQIFYEKAIENIDDIQDGLQQFYFAVLNRNIKEYKLAEEMIDKSFKSGVNQAQKIRQSIPQVEVNDKKNLSDQLLEEGIKYFNGKLNYPINIDKAIDFFKKASEIGCPKADYYLGSYYRNEEGAKYLEKSVKCEDPDGMNLYAFNLMNGFLTKKDHEKAMEYFKKAADKGQEEAAYEYGRQKYLNGLTESEKEEGLFYLKKSAEKLFPDALYLYSKHIEKIDPYDSKKFFEIAVEKGSQLAMEEQTKKYDEHSQDTLNTFQFKTELILPDNNLNISSQEKKPLIRKPVNTNTVKSIINQSKSDTNSEPNSVINKDKNASQLTNKQKGINSLTKSIQKKTIIFQAPSEINTSLSSLERMHLLNDELETKSEIEEKKGNLFLFLKEKTNDNDSKGVKLSYCPKSEAKVNDKILADKNTQKEKIKSPLSTILNASDDLKLKLLQQDTPKKEKDPKNAESSNHEQNSLSISSILATSENLQLISSKRTSSKESDEENEEKLLLDKNISSEKLYSIFNKFKNEYCNSKLIEKRDKSKFRLFKYEDNFINFNNAYIVYQYAKIYEDEEENKENKEKSMFYFDKAAFLGNPEAQAHSGFCHLNGIGTYKDQKIGIVYLKKSADQGNLKGIHLYGMSLYNGNGVSENKEEGLNYIKKAADKGYVESQYQYGLLVSNPFISHQYIEKAALNHYEKAMFQYAKDYMEGHGVVKDIQKASEIFGELYEKERSNEVLINLIKFLKKIDISLAIPYMKLLSDCDDKTMISEIQNQQFEYGLELFKGKNIKQDIEESIKYLIKSKQISKIREDYPEIYVYMPHDFSPVQEEIDRFLKRNGSINEEEQEMINNAIIGNIEDTFKAAKIIESTGDYKTSNFFYEIAADSNHAEASLIIGGCYLNGMHGLEKNKEKGDKYLNRALKIDSNNSKSSHVKTNVTEGKKTISHENKPKDIKKETNAGNFKKTFSYTGRVETVTLSPGRYQLEVWGAEGGKNHEYSKTPGKGGYSVGLLKLVAETKLYIHVGESPFGDKGGWNGGGSGSKGNESSGAGGGGATDISLFGKEGTSNWNNEDHLYSRIIVAGGGGGSGNDDFEKYYGGFGGGTSGECSGYGPLGNEGTQICAGDSNPYSNGQGFGIGATHTGSSTSGGGGGWYGGGAPGNQWCFGGGSGGSGYVYTSTTASNYPEGCKLDASYMLTYARTEQGNKQFPMPNSLSLETGHEGHGCARIIRQ